MTILLVNYEYPPLGGGAANATQCIGRALAGRGHAVHVLTSGLRGAADAGGEAGIRVHRLPVGRARPDRARQWEMIAFMLGSRFSVARLGRELRPDAAIAFFTLPSGPAALRLHRLSGAPYIVSLRGGDVPGHVPGLGARHALTRPLRRAVLRHAAAIVANSQGLAATSRAADPFPVRVIPNGVDSVRFHPPPVSDARGADGKLRLLFVGRVHPEKNLGAVLRQLAALPPPERDRFELRVAGDGSQRPELEALAGELGLSSRVHWLGWQEKAALPSLYREADALVNPSLYEGMPNVALEAMASALPVFASDVPGNRAAVTPGVTGELFPLDRPEVLGAALARLAADAAWGRALGLEGRRRAEAEFSWERTAQSYLELLPPLATASRSA